MAKLREDSGDAHANSGTQYAVSVGDEFHGSLNPVNDKDWLRVELTAGTIYDIILNGVYSARLTILDARGNEVANGISNFNFTKIRIFSPDTSGTYYISIGSSNTDHTANYEISLDENPITTVSHDVIADYMSSRRPHNQAFDVESGGVLSADITALNEAGQQLARWALEAWTSVTGIQFEFVNDDAHITFDDNQDRPDVASASRSTSDGFIVSAHINVPANWIPDDGARMDSHVFYAYLHEIGHALGLDHPGPYSASYLPLIDKIFLNDTWQTTVMSYFRQDHDKFVDASFAYPVTPMVADIIAIQTLYGLPTGINAGDTVYGHGSSVAGYLGELFELWSGEGDSSFENPVTLTLYDSGGIDTLDLRTDTTDQRVDLRPEGFSNVYGLVGNLVIAQDTLIENFIGGSGNDTVTGNDAANHLQGGDGNDDLRGGGGDDVLEGGAGADRLDGGPGMDWTSYQGSNVSVTVNLAEGTLSGGHAAGDVPVNIENIIGSAYADVLTGDDGANSLEGGAGADRLAGGTGEDSASYTRSAAGVTVRLHSGEVRGGDAEGDTFTAMVTVEYTGSDGTTQQETVPDIEHLVGSSHADTLAGDSRDNRLTGGGGNDRLYGGPGGGDDMLEGGPGEDALYGGIGDDVMEGGADADTLRGGPGADTGSYAQSDTGVEIRLHSGVVQGGHADGDVLDGIENLRGSAYADILEGDGSANRLDGGDGTDWVSYRGSDAAVTVKLRDGTGTGGHAEGDVIAGIENIEGSDYNDIFGGDSQANHLAGRDGNDGLWGSNGDDVLEGGAGADRIYGGPDTDTVVYWSSDAAVTVNLAEGTGTGGHAQGDTIAEVENAEGSGFGDVLEGDGGSNRLYGGEGDDELKGGGGDDFLEGGAGADRLDGGAGIDMAFYRASNEAVTVNLGDGTASGGHAEGDEFTSVEGITGSVYDDTLTGGNSADRLDGGDGADVLEGGAGADKLDGGTGTDTAVYRNSNAAVTVNLGNGTFTGGHAAGDTAVNIENLEGSDYDDVLTGDSGANHLYGGEGDDVLEGGEGIDRLDGGAGVDTVTYENSADGMSVNLQQNRGSSESSGVMRHEIFNMENVIGSESRDSIRGDRGANDLYGRGADDQLNGGAGDDRLFGEAGDDQLWGLTGADRLDGGTGMDIAVYWSSNAAVTVSLANGTGHGGHAEGDVLVGVENLWGSDHNDVLSGDNGANRLYGGRGNDELSGNSGNDVLEGDIGADRLDGGPGMDTVSYSLSNEGVTVKLGEGIMEGGHADGDVFVSIEAIEGSRYDDVLEGDNGANRLSGGIGDDSLKGNGGADLFIFEHSNRDDVILDFTDGEDKIDLTDIGLSGFDDLILSSDSDGVTIHMTTSGGGSILLEGFDIANLDASDFIF